ncbi:group III truncated hemoglobin [Sphingomonas psychrotolerans]|uniref:Preprotein translocase subunit TatC n=1 Tax=Sphingomonas psychrotolerans TaxID=1327635 RepID=A0A2K8MPF3_9SPHN|nr:group III truncated hemoglobin [Sphingomonas psychrotolerans]ATY33291.1 preprotein translocase subunit TatC [Sphingomonas psychrotolerans]
MTSPALTEDDLNRVVEAFYASVRTDEMLGPIFNGAIHDWPGHLATLQAFWSSVMLTSGRYKGQPMVAHTRHAAEISPAMFERWLVLWRETTDALLPADAAAAMQERAARIAESLMLGIDFYRNRTLGVRS